jgi:hypothetical protein
MRSTFVSAAVIAASLGITPALSAQQPPAGGAQEPVAALKQSLQQGQALIRQYEWIETTIISLKGEEKARKQHRCYYGADGKVQKIAIGEPAPPQAAASGGGRRSGRLKQQIVENKKDDIQEYMERAVSLVHRYVPPQPAQIQAAKDAGRVAVRAQAGGQVQIEIAQYLLPADKLALDLDPGGSRLIGLGVDTYLDTPEDPVTLAVQMGALPDGATYAAQTTLDAKAKNIRVVIQNTGHRPVTR